MKNMNALGQTPYYIWAHFGSAILTESEEASA